MKYLILFVAFLTTIPLSAQNPLADADRIAKSFVNKRNHKGLYLSIILGGKTYSKGYGKIKKGIDTPPHAQSIFEIGGVTQVFTSNILLFTVKEGLANLEDPVQKYVPKQFATPTYFPIKCYDTQVKIRTNPGDPYSGYEYPITTCRPDPLGEELYISLCDLATHSSGLSESPSGLFPWNPFKAIKQLKNPYATYSEKDLYEHLSDYIINQPPGTRYKYSNTGMALLGNILSEIHGEPIDKLLEYKINWPLGLTNTSFILNDFQKTNLVQGHSKKGKQKTPWDFKALAPALGLKSSPEDLVKFIKANISTDSKYLSEIFELSHQPKVDIKQPYEARKNSTVGYGWTISPISIDKNYPIVWSSGQTGGYSCFIAFNKELDLGIVLMANSSHRLDEIGFDIISGFVPYTNRLTNNSTAKK